MRINLTGEGLPESRMRAYADNVRILGYELPDDISVYGYDGTFVNAVQDAVREWMTAYAGDMRKVPVVIHTDQHGQLKNSTKFFQLLGDLVTWDNISAVLNLGDTVVDSYSQAAISPVGNSVLEEANNALAYLPDDKRLEIWGNHDINSAGQTLMEKNLLRPYFRCGFRGEVCPDNSGNAVYYDDTFHIKYMTVTNYDNAGTWNSYRISSAHFDWIIRQMEKNDGYPMVLLTHVPIDKFIQSGASPISGTGGTAETLGLILARKNGLAGTYTDIYGVSHVYDFTGTTDTPLLCSMHGHDHAESFRYNGGTEQYSAQLLQAVFNRYTTFPRVYLVLIDQVGAQLNIWRVQNSGTMVENWQVPFVEA